ncbi:MAG TPA: LysE family translocator [Rhodoferax sp.]|jgi:threonine/homoserine/homoserine lactone efflux protein|nr:LysE family translocator [Rhodoferax sp.]HNV60118.1 LysE family translocator [Rhodoferax sp.]HPW30452.1 LysE family translocator [Rhodoferax sp.]
MPIDQLLLFIAAGLLLNLTPGPDVLYIVSNALRGGARVGMVAALGITAGCFVHILAAAAGVSALMAASATAFTVLKWVGAAYLVYVGSRLLLSHPPSAIKLEAAGACSTGAGGQFDYQSIFLGGFWTNVLNPKVALFFLAFLPQFIAPTVENKPMAFLLLGLLFNFNGLWVNLGWALAAAWLAGRAGVVQRSMQWLDRLAGALFVTFGIKLALAQSPNT